MALKKTPMIMPPKITDAIFEFCRKIDKHQSPEYILHRPEKTARMKNCFLDLREKVKIEGGQIIYGWAIWEWPNVYLEAEFHGIWNSPNDILTDITPRSFETEQVLFLPDKKRRFDYDKEGFRIGNKFMPLSSDSTVIELINTNREIFHFEEELSEGINIFPTEQYYELQAKKSELLLNISSRKVGRNDPCSCGSGKKYKKCCSRE